MRPTLLIAAGMMMTVAASSQITEGKVVYERKMNMHKSLPPEAEQFKAMIPEYQTSKMELAFKDQRSLYRPAKSDDEEMPSTEMGGGGGMRVMRFGGGADGESFKDYETDTKTDIRELGPKKYLLDDSLTHYTWKLSPDTMTIMGHLCHKATTTLKGGLMGMARQRFGFGGGGPRREGNDNRVDSATRNMRIAKDQEVVAWFADDITSPSGPDNFGGLPGLILHLDIDEGTLVFTPLSFDKDPGTVKAPSNGKKITREEYRKMMEEQMGGMMRGRGPGGGGPRIIINN